MATNRPPSPAGRQITRHWEALVAAATAVVKREDAHWRKRRRVFGSLLIVLFVLSLAVTRGVMVTEHFVFAWSEVRLGRKTTLITSNNIYGYCRAIPLVPQDG